MRIGKWSEPRVVFVCQLVDVMREADANETSGELGVPVEDAEVCAGNRALQFAASRIDIA